VGRVKLEASKCAYEVYMLVFDPVWLASFYSFVWGAIFIFEGHMTAYMYLPVVRFDSGEISACIDSLMVWNSVHPEVPCLDCVVWRSSVFIGSEPILLTRRFLEGELPINRWNEIQVEEEISGLWTSREMVVLPTFEEFMESSGSDRYNTWVLVFDELLRMSLRFVEVKTHFMLREKYVCLTLETFTRFYKEAFRVLSQRLFSNFFEYVSFPIKEFEG
jgi:hypothetical protein